MSKYRAWLMVVLAEDNTDVTGQGRLHLPCIMLFPGTPDVQQSPGVDIFGNVVNNAVAPGWTGEQLDPVVRKDVMGDGVATHRKIRE